MFIAMHRVKVHPENEEEARQIAQAQAQQKDEQGEYLESLAAEANANAQESLANVAKNTSQASLNEAKTAETIAGIDLSRFKALAEVIDQRQQNQASLPQLRTIQ